MEEGWLDAPAEIYPASMPARVIVIRIKRELSEKPS
jgi:hypothetical protein